MPAGMGGGGMKGDPAPQAAPLPPASRNGQALPPDLQSLTEGVSYRVLSLDLALQQLADDPAYALTECSVTRERLREAYAEPTERLKVALALRRQYLKPDEVWPALGCTEAAPVSRRLPLRDAPDSPLGATDNSAEAWREDLDVAGGRTRETLANYLLAFAHLPCFQQALRYDGLQDLLTFHGAPVEDAELGQISHLLYRHLRLSVSRPRLLLQALHAAARSLPVVDPLCDYLDSLPAWDRTLRVPSWISRYLGAAEGPYTAWVGHVLLCAMVARGREPGCQQRYTIILEGRENTGKSAFVHALGAPWTLELLRGLEGVEAQRLLRGKWVVELPELDSWSRAEATRIKAFLTLRSDSLRRLYSTTVVDYPRRAVFLGTTNGDCYLTGEDGNTRFLPLATGRIDVAGFQAVRDQLLAEAQACIDAGFPWWEEPTSLRESLAETREARRTPGIYDAVVQDWLDTRGPALPSYVTIEEVLSNALLLVDREGTPLYERWKDQALQRQITSAMRVAGWVRVQKKVQGRNRRVYVRRDEAS